eukprot:1155858-Rhodomonas_salina.1
MQVPCPLISLRDVCAALSCGSGVEELSKLGLRKRLLERLRRKEAAQEAENEAEREVFGRAGAVGGGRRRNPARSCRARARLSLLGS